MSLESPAEKAGLKEKDVIKGIKDGPIFNHQIDFSNSMRNYKANDRVQLVIERGGNSETLTIQVTSREKYERDINKWKDHEGKRAKF